MTGLSAILIEDKNTNTFTAFVQEYPGVVIQASTKEKAKEELNIAFDNFITYLKRQHNFTYKEEELPYGAQ